MPRRFCQPVNALAVTFQRGPSADVDIRRAAGGGGPLKTDYGGEKNSVRFNWIVLISV